MSGRIHRPQIVRPNDLAVVHHAGDAAHAGIPHDIARIIAVRYGRLFIICPQFILYLLCINYASCIILTNSMTPVDFPHDAAGVGCFGKIGCHSCKFLRVDGAAIRAGLDIDVISIHVAYDAAHIADYHSLTPCIPITHVFKRIASIAHIISIKDVIIRRSCCSLIIRSVSNSTRAGSHDVAAVIGALLYCALPAKITGDAAHVVRAANLILPICSVRNVCIFRASYNASYVTSFINILFLYAAVYIARV